MRQEVYRMSEFDSEFDEKTGPSYCKQCDEPTSSDISVSDDEGYGVICYRCDELNSKGE